MSKQTKIITVSGLKIGGRQPLLAIAGPCVIESQRGCMDLAARLVDLAVKVDIPLIFKASYDKANRTSIDSYRGPGVVRLDILMTSNKFNAGNYRYYTGERKKREDDRCVAITGIPLQATDLVVGI